MAKQNKSLLIVGIIVLLIIAGSLFYFTGKQIPTYSTQITQGGSTSGQKSGPENINITILDSPTYAQAGQQFTIRAAITSDKQFTTQDVDVRYGSQSVLTPLTTNYQYSSQPIGGKIPDFYTLSFSIASNGTYYFRIHISVNGNDYWSDEKIIIVR
jgi:hypothetical protein